jgi:hypothetical protein
MSYNCFLDIDIKEAIIDEDHKIFQCRVHKFMIISPKYITEFSFA